MLVPVSFVYGCANASSIVFGLSSYENGSHEIQEDLRFFFLHYTLFLFLIKILYLSTLILQISVGLVTEIPLWLAARLDSSGLIEIELPFNYQRSKRRNLKA